MDHAREAEKFNSDHARVSWHDQSLWFVRAKRDKAAHHIPEWEALRACAAEIKDHTLSHLDEYLMAFEKNARANGVHVHWASDADEHNAIVRGILQSKDIQQIVKSKSMLTEECGLNDYLTQHGIAVIDTDLGERIIQLAGEHPSHIVLPAIHKKKEEVGEIFHKNLQTEKGNADPLYLAGAARQHLREKFLTSNAAITGVNFAVAETGGVVVCTNEGNADLGVNEADVHIACMGMEKLIPKMEDLSVFLRLLARSATGQLITAYSSHFQRPQAGKEMHIVIVDNGRSEHLGRADYYRALRCIRCGACMNTCPVYRRSGGHSYSYTIPGPIGSILAPARDLNKHSSMPFASTLCGSCSDVCPVKIDIHEQLYKWRQEVVKAGQMPQGKNIAMKLMSKVLASPRLYVMSGKWTRWMLRILPKSWLNARPNVWGRKRDLPEIPRQSFKTWYNQNRKQ